MRGQDALATRGRDAHATHYSPHADEPSATLTTRGRDAHATHYWPREGKMPSPRVGETPTPHTTRQALLAGTVRYLPGDFGAVVGLEAG